MIIFASFGVIAFIISILLKAEDRRKGYGLELPNIKGSKAFFVRNDRKRP